MKRRGSVMARKSLMLLVGFLMFGGCATPLFAGETGIAAIHAWHQVRNKTCIKSHWHYGSATGRATRQAAEAEAINVWVNFTAVDYGTDWMSYKLAEDKASKCERTGEAWGCIVEGRACKLTKGVRRVNAAKN